MGLFSSLLAAEDFAVGSVKLSIFAKFIFRWFTKVTE